MSPDIGDHPNGHPFLKGKQCTRQNFQPKNLGAKILLIPVKSGSSGCI